MPFLGASIIAGAIYFVLSFLSGLYLEGPDATAITALVSAAVKTAVFSTLFHYAHNWIARLLGWYRLDRPDDKHTFDRTPALDQVRAGSRSE